MTGNTFDGLLHRGAASWLVAVICTTVGGPQLGSLLATGVLFIGLIWCVVYLIVRATPPEVWASNGLTPPDDRTTSVVLSRDE